MMQNNTILPRTQGMITDLSQQLHIPEVEVIARAVDLYAEKLKKKLNLMSFAGILTETEADDLLETIQTSRVNKTEDIQV